jgi:hypothetical protein
MANTYTLIQAQTLASSAASVTFSAIPSTYTDLVFRISARTNFAAVVDYFIMRLNSDTASNYSETRLVAFAGTATLSDRYSNQTSIQDISQNGDTSTSNTFSSTEVYIPSYAVAQNKPMSAISVVENNSASANQIVADAILWRNTATVSSVSFAPSAGTNFLTGSSFYLYGIKNS